MGWIPPKAAVFFLTEVDSLMAALVPDRGQEAPSPLPRRQREAFLILKASWLRPGRREALLTDMRAQQASVVYIRI